MGIEGSPGVGKDHLLDIYLEILEQSDSSIAYRSITAGSDISLLSQAKKVIECMSSKEVNTLLCIKISELNLRPKNELFELLLWAKQMAVPLKVISTENASSIGHRFERDLRIKDEFKTLSEMNKDDYTKIVKKMWGDHSTLSLDLKLVVDDHIVLIDDCRELNRPIPSLRQLAFLIRNIKKMKKIDDYFVESYALYGYDGRDVSEYLSEYDTENSQEESKYIQNCNMHVTPGKNPQKVDGKLALILVTHHHLES